MPDIVLTETVTVTEHEITDEERALSKKYNRLVDTCLDWAFMQMRFGLPATKLALSRSVITSASRLAAIDTKTHQQEQRLAFQSLLREVTTLDESSVTALPRSVIDQD